jgi:hypothetical protein
MTDPPEIKEAQRDETPAQRLDRNTLELLNELRIDGAGIQVIFAFLLILPFNAGWVRVDSFDRTVYFITLLVVALAAFLLLAPAIQHRILFRRGQKSFLIRTGNSLAIAGQTCIGLGFVGILVLVSNVVVGGAAPVIVGVLAGALLVGLWFVFPVVHREES